ncbi:late expression factor 9 [Spodoptera litura nucleopolyhedrovirus]|uniref:Late expression factor 9 n=6 Tax=Alphabaculovirus TaxID=558016 RepID=Q91BG6_NPVST|nr:LEF-9 [Spodoptera litura nucleopolyhedrovirus]WML75125.1 DNA-directed RNA polymerase subunit lef-9 [Spodoptera littoralis nucleopolyhedrovirus]AAL01741.1 late expression factor 9 [Spodoptera litura nucleopolyhedrovirus]QHN73909.1 lef-9 [Spodoptera litura nucleopolyhedrovirus]UQV25588.1 LEF-9 [Spodoptera litura nucleopolyhedrovirus]WOC30920.1 DNA-directed RNA polymerase subunit LEF-9 [Spodoptera litura nucleopolyhedrovirus]
MYSATEGRVEFVDKEANKFNLLVDPSDIENVYFITLKRFRVFLKDLITDLKKIKTNFFNSLVEQLISVYSECSNRNNHTETLSEMLKATSIVITDLPSNVFLKKLKTNKFTDDIDYLILPNFILWDHNFIIFLNKSFNAKHDLGLVDIYGSLQKIKLTHGVIKDQLQSKNGYAGQYLYSTFLNTASFYANVQCINATNEIVPPKASVRRYYGRDVSNVRAWTTRHPNISQLSTQVFNVREPADYEDWNIKIGLGTFTGPNRDCDGDKEVITYMPKPNSLIDLECLLYGDPRYNFICFDKNRLSFVSQQIYYLYKNEHRIRDILSANMPLILCVWDSYNKSITFATRLDMLLRDCALLISSNASYLLFETLTKLIDKCEMVCGDKEIFELSGEFRDIIESGAKGSVDLVESTKRYKSTDAMDIDTIADRAIKGLNNHITSHNRVKVGGGDIYHNTTVMQNVYMKNDMICYKRDDCRLMSICALPSEFLFPEHLLDLFLK